jgi:hypothetical protein
MFGGAIFVFDPWSLALADAIAHLGLERRGSKCKPLLLNLIEKHPASRGRKFFQPIKSLRCGRFADWHGNVDRTTAPHEICGQEDHSRIVRAHPFGQRTCRCEPAADEFPARILRARFIDRAVSSVAMGAWLSWTNIVTVDIDFQPAVATCRARTACSAAISFRFVVLRHGDAFISRKANIRPRAFAEPARGGGVDVERT